MGKKSPKPLTLGAIIGRRVGEERRRQGLNQDELVARLAKLGRPMDRSTLGYIERGKGKGQLESLVALALALGVSPIHLMLPRESEEVVELTTKRHLSARDARLWISGRKPLRDSNPDAWAAAMASDELQTLVAKSIKGGTPITRALASGPAAERLLEGIEDDFAGRATARKRQRRQPKEGNDG